MKKLLVVLAAAGLLFAMSSCDKTCTCKSFLGGNVVTESEVELDKDNTNIKKCSDMNTYVTDNNGNKTGLECK
ncbi:MAG: hypothetical protein IKO34_03255 [Bacteroidales bacterium]|jgi:hypothetical protein|nr:hypothetical protein [Bacteroidales bacterium]MBR4582810.1 hypothetical protein [Bacteroidales bacterium]